MVLCLELIVLTLLPAYLMYEHHQFSEVELIQHPHNHDALSWPRGDDKLSCAVIGMSRGHQKAATFDPEPFLSLGLGPSVPRSLVFYGLVRQVGRKVKPFR